MPLPYYPARSPLGERPCVTKSSTSARIPPKIGIRCSVAIRASCIGTTRRIRVDSAYPSCISSSTQVPPTPRLPHSSYQGDPPPRPDSKNRTSKDKRPQKRAFVDHRTFYDASLTRRCLHLLVRAYGPAAMPYVSWLSSLPRSLRCASFYPAFYHGLAC